MTTPWDVLAQSIRKVSDRVDAMPVVREATAVSDNFVRFDTDASDTRVHGSLTTNLRAGDRVLTLTLRHYVWVLGARGGGATSGEVRMTASASAPLGWLLCQGQSLLRADYPALFSSIGTTYGAADSTRFTLPDLRGRVVVGRDASQTEFDTLGEAGGAKTHTLTTAEMPSHGHTMNNSGGGNLGYGEGSNPNQYTVGFGSVRPNTGVATAVTGGGQAHNNLQPYITMNYIIKI